MTLKDRTAVVGIGATPYYKRGQSPPQSELELACRTILLALDDAGLGLRDLDGFALYASSCDPAQVASVLGLPEVRFAATLTSGGGGSAGALGLAAAAITSGQAEVCVTLMTLHARMISDPLCLYDYTMENDGAVAAIVTSAERARDLRHPPVYVMGSAHGALGRWGSAIFTYFQIDCDPESVKIGDKLRVRFDRVSDTDAVPRFVPLGPGRPG